LEFVVVYCRSSFGNGQPTFSVLTIAFEVSPQKKRRRRSVEDLESEEPESKLHKPSDLKNISLLLKNGRGGDGFSEQY